MHTHDTGLDGGGLPAGLPLSVSAVSLHLALLVTGIIASATQVGD